MMRSILGAAALALAFAVPAAAAEPRNLDVPATASWKHANSGIILSPSVAGLTRTKIVDRTADELDVSATYDAADEGIVGTFFIYRTEFPETAIWYDRAVTAILTTPDYGLEGRQVPAATPFTRPRSSGMNGLRMTMPAGGADFKSTSLAITRLGNFLVKVRLSSSRLDAASLDARMTAFLEALRWPETSKAENAVAEVRPCPTPLTYKKAKVVKTDMGVALAGLLMGATEGLDEEGEQERSGPPPVYCRDGEPQRYYAAYRANESKDSYVLALGDAGIAVEVGGSEIAALLGKGKKSFPMFMLDRNSRSSLLSFNRLPPPEQAMQVALGGGGDGLSVSVKK